MEVYSELSSCKVYISLHLYYKEHDFRYDIHGANGYLRTVVKYQFGAD